MEIKVKLYNGGNITELEYVDYSSGYLIIHRFLYKTGEYYGIYSCICYNMDDNEIDNTINEKIECFEKPQEIFQICIKKYDEYRYNFWF